MDAILEDKDVPHESESSKGDRFAMRAGNPDFVLSLALGVSAIESLVGLKACVGNLENASRIDDIS